MKKWIVRRSTVLIVLALGYGACVMTAVATHDIRLVNFLLVFVSMVASLSSLVFYRRMTTVDKDKYTPIEALAVSYMIGVMFFGNMQLHLSWQRVSPATLTVIVLVPTTAALGVCLAMYLILLTGRYQAARQHFVTER